VEGGPGLADAQRAGVAAYEKLIAELSELNSEVLAVAAELSHGTIETVLAKGTVTGRQPGIQLCQQRPAPGQHRRLGCQPRRLALRCLLLLR
jgi:hypothetical protein